jgi:hypothetical protein
MKEFEKIQDVVKQLLESDPRLRDCDRKLMARIWANQIGEDKAKEITGYEFLVAYATNKKLSNPATIIRVRRKIQLEHEALRGKSYIAKQKRSAEARKYFRE